MDHYSHEIDCVVGMFRTAKRVLFITGAGVSADSGLPTYRGVGGLYNDAKTSEGYEIEECLSGSMFDWKPEITWKYMLQVGEAVLAHRPNAAHEAIARLQRDFEIRGGKVLILTQNIDGYHTAAGATDVMEIHGSFRELFCTKCSWKTPVELDEEKILALVDRKTLPPRCPTCNAVIRPKIVLFEEMLPRDVLDRFDAEFDHGYGVDLVVSIGTSSVFPYIFGPVVQAAEKGKNTVEINPVAGDLSEKVAIHLPLRAVDAMPEIVRRLH